MGCFPGKPEFTLMNNTRTVVKCKIIYNIQYINYNYCILIDDSITNYDQISDQHKSELNTNIYS